MKDETKKTDLPAGRHERLASAVYFLTSFFSDKEPMKWRLRELAGNLVAAAEPSHIVLEMEGLFSVAKNAGLISDTNFSIIHKELRSVIAGRSSLSELLPSLSAPREEIRDLSAPTQSRHLEPAKPLYVGSSVAKPFVIKDKSGSVAIKRNDRQNTILNLLKKKKEIMIKDVVPLIDGVSEKTVQRELLSMVEAGILRKIGEKRWSRYTLAESA